MKIGDQVKIILEIAPPCSCVSCGRGDEVMNCARHGLPERKKSPEIKIISGVVQGFCEPTRFSPKTVLVGVMAVGLTTAQFEFGTGALFMCEGRKDSNILSMRLDEKDTPIDVPNKIPYEPLDIMPIEIKDENR